MKTPICKICGAEYERKRVGQKVCSPGCAIALAKQEQSKKSEKQEKIRQRERKEKVKTRAEWLREAQQAFNAFIRERDKGKPCISCGRYHDGQYHAGHYRTVGAAPQLRFNEDNCHLQCAPCNNHLSGNIVNYRPRLIEKIGIDRVNELENNHESLKLSIEDIKAIKEKYKLKLKSLKCDLNQKQQ